MNLSRLNSLLTAGVVPLNYGMDYEACIKFYDKNKDTMSDLCPTDPRTWTEETKQAVNTQAKEEKELVERMMLLSDDEFNAKLSELLELSVGRCSRRY